MSKDAQAEMRFDQQLHAYAQKQAEAEAKRQSAEAKRQSDQAARDNRMIHLLEQLVSRLPAAQTE